MNRIKRLNFNLILFAWLLFISLLVYAGCGNNATENTVVSNAAIGETFVADGEVIIDNDDFYYAALEKKLNDELNLNLAPDKCAAPGLTKISFNITTDEIMTCSTYDLSKIFVTAYFSDKTAEVVTPV